MNNQNVNDAEVEQSEPISIIENLRERAFDSSNEKLGLALGRPTSEIEASSKETSLLMTMFSSRRGVLRRNDR